MKLYRLAAIPELPHHRSSVQYGTPSNWQCHGCDLDHDVCSDEALPDQDVS